MKSRNIISIVLIVGILALIVLLYNSIMRPVKFDAEYNKRSAEVIVKLKDIRAIQEAYKGTNGKFCGDIDSLIIFLETGKVNMVKKYGVVPDSLTEAQALKAGIIKRDTVEVNPLEKLLEENKLITKDINALKNLKYIPYSDNKIFDMKADIIERSGVKVPTFEATADIFTYTKGMKEQDVINLKAEVESKNRYAGWRVGDVTQPITDGNWE
ncbi:MAG: hypothetical protein PHN41_02905 [Bacteroidales bacterium]|jgi:hypothetical protein|nr:hypothetical protein [Bacteroidales bacterium]MDD4703205.1 hypothetical protein [Bacteroidales bacterium]MDX9797387.1 hypothetical protein [Bacteroidales bacterium]